MKEQKQKEDDKKVLTDHFIGTLPPLLNKVNNFILYLINFNWKYFSILLMLINYLIYYNFHFILIMKFIQQHDVNVILMLI
jgi:hypothetical protein